MSATPTATANRETWLKHRRELRALNQRITRIPHVRGEEFIECTRCRSWMPIVDFEYPDNGAKLGVCCVCDRRERREFPGEGRQVRAFRWRNVDRLLDLVFGVEWRFKPGGGFIRYAKDKL